MRYLHLGVAFQVCLLHTESEFNPDAVRLTPVYPYPLSLFPKMLCVYAFLFLILNGVGLGSLPDKLNDFGLRVFTQLAQSSQDKNVALSPYGVSTVLAMAQLGAAGSTRKALTTAMGFSLQGEWHMDSKEEDILLANVTLMQNQTMTAHT